MKMNLWKKTVSLGLSAAVFFTSAPVYAQAFLPIGRDEQAFAGNFQRVLEEAALSRRSDMTVYHIMEQYVRYGSVDGAALAAVLDDEEYIRSLNVEEAGTLSFLSQYVGYPTGNYGAGWEDKLAKAVLSRLGDYQESDPDFALHSFYAMVAVSLGHNPYMYRMVEDWAFEQVALASRPADSARRGWAAEVLANLAVVSEDDVWPAQRREAFEWRLESLIRQFDWLQNARADYKMTGVKNRLGASNQNLLIQLFAQANNFFSMKDKDGILKQMFSAGGLNPVGRAIAGREYNDRFSDTGESFYLHAVTPGTDGKGHFADSVNGRRHFILASLIKGLFLSYHTRSWQESSELMERFVRSYLTADKENHFIHYLYIPLSGMRLGMALHFASTLNGWEKEESSLQKELYSTLKKGYPWHVVCTTLQGACEVSAEWVALGDLFAVVFRGMGWGVKMAGRQVINHLPPRALMHLALVEMAGRQGSKAVVRWSKQTIKTLLKQAGWKGVGVGTAAGAVLLYDPTTMGAKPQALAR